MCRSPNTTVVVAAQLVIGCASDVAAATTVAFANSPNSSRDRALAASVLQSLLEKGKLLAMRLELMNEPEGLLKEISDDVTRFEQRRGSL